VNGIYQRAHGVTWVLRGAGQVPLETSSREWPSGNATWTLALPKGTELPLLRVLSARFAYRRRVTTSQQLLFSGDATSPASLTQTTERTVAPSVMLTWVGGVSTSYDLSRSTTEAFTASNLFRTTRTQQGAGLSFAFRPPSSILRRQNVIRTNLHYSSSQDGLCLQAAGQETCVSYVDTRQSQTQFSLDTDFPPSLSAGLQMAYVVNDQRQFNHKTAQLVVTVFVNFSTSVGQLR
jgi:hypothetical protein